MEHERFSTGQSRKMGNCFLKGFLLLYLQLQGRMCCLPGVSNATQNVIRIQVRRVVTTQALTSSLTGSIYALALALDPPPLCGFSGLPSLSPSIFCAAGNHLSLSIRGGRNNPEKDIWSATAPSDEAAVGPSRSERGRRGKRSIIRKRKKKMAPLGPPT